MDEDRVFVDALEAFPSTLKLVLSGHVWAKKKKKKWSLNTAGLLKRDKIYVVTAFGT